MTRAPLLTQWLDHLLGRDALRAELQALTARLDKAEALLVATTQLTNAHDGVLRRWVAESATFRDIEERHRKKLQRAAADAQPRIEDEDGG